MVRMVASTLALLLLTSAGQAASYIACDNGLRCFRAPCPSTNLLDVRSRKVGRVSGVDLSKLPASERRRAENAEAVYSGSLVLNGRIARKRFAGTPGDVLVVNRLGRKTTSAERRMCRAGGS